jgi:Beta-propeller repeat
MVNRGGVGAFVASRAAIVIGLMTLSGFFLLRHDISSLAHAKASVVAARADAVLRGMPLGFEPNQGQSDPQVKFLARGSGYGLYFTHAEAVLAFPAPKAMANGGLARSAVSMQFAGANPAAQVDAAQPLPGHTNYLLGSDPSRWHRNIPQFARVQYRNLYPGVDLDFYGKQGRLEYDFEVGPGADPRGINLRFQGMRDMQIAANGDLVLALDGRELRFQAPHVYQKSPAGEQNVAGKFALRAGNQVGFEVGDYDRSHTLVIDPVLTFSTLLGGSGAESCAALAGAQFVAHCPAIAVDSANRVYIAGATSSTAGFPTPAGGLPGMVGPGGGGSDVFVARISNSGSSLALDYLTFVGGGGVDYPVGIAVDSGFNVYLAGNTTSSDFPTTSAGFQTSAAIAGNHAFVTQLDSSASGALYSTYLSGNGVDTASDMALDNQGRIYVIGTTTLASGTGNTFPVTPGALQATALASSQFFFSKLNPTLSGPNSLLYSTFIGGSTPSSGVVTGGGIAVDANLNVYLAGGTNFTDMPIVNAFQGTNLGGLDVWAAKLTAPANNTEQYTPLYETYFGGSGDEVAYGVAADPTSTSLYVTGSTTTAGISSPVSTVPLQASYGGGTDAFVAKFGVPVTSGTTQGSVPLSYFTYLGGSGQDVGLAIIADSNQNARVAGFTASGSLPNPNPLFNSTGGGLDAFFARIVTTTTTTTNTSTTSVLGGSGTDRGTSTAVDASLNSYIAGETASGNFPTASDPSVPAVTALQTNLSGASDAFVSKIGPNTTGLSFICSGTGCPSPAPANPAVNPSPVGVGSSVTFTYSIYNLSDPVTGAVFTDNIGLPANSSLTTATASSGTCTTSGTSALCNLGTVNSSNTTTSGTTTTTSVAATVTITVLASVPASTGTTPTKPPSIGNSGTLTVAGTNFQKTASGTASVNDFGIQVAPNTQTVNAGNQGSYVLTVTPTGIFPESVSLACGSGLPSQATCSFSAANPIPNLSNGPQSRTLDITTVARVTTPASLFRRGPIYAFWLPISGLVLVGSGNSRRRRWLIAIALVAVLGGVTLQSGCSNTNSTSTTVGTPAGTYTITVNATSGSATRTTAVTLIVK